MATGPKQLALRAPGPARARCSCARACNHPGWPLVPSWAPRSPARLPVARATQAAEQLGLPRIVSIQNSYSLLVRGAFETDLAEVCAPRQCNVGLLAYSPLAGGERRRGKGGDGDSQASAGLASGRSFTTLWPDAGLPATQPVQPAVATVRVQHCIRLMHAPVTADFSGLRTP